MASVKSKVPKLRFKGFSGEWNITKLCDISDKVQEKNKNNLINETFTNSAEYGIINQRDFFNKDISNEINLCHYYVVQPNDFVYNPRISNLAPVGPIKRNKLNRIGVMSPLYYVFRTYLINNDFLDYYFSTSKWHRFMFMNGDKGARSDRFAISDSVFRTMPIFTPKQQEQTQIGHFFQKLDQVIEIQQNALTQAQNYKKAMLQKMFPQNGEKRPKRRFKGFSGDWVKVKFRDIFIYERPDNYLVSNTEYLDQGIPVLTANKSFILGFTDEKNIYDKGACIIFDDFTLDSKYVDFAYMVKSSAIKILTPTKGFDLKFAFERLNTEKIINDGHARHYISIVQPTITLVPSLKEQTQIGNFFQQLDKQITEQQNKLTHYQTLKKAMLQRLFI